MNAGAGPSSPGLHCGSQDDHLARRDQRRWEMERIVVVGQVAECSHASQEACAGQYPAASHSRADFAAAARGRASLSGPGPAF